MSVINQMLNDLDQRSAESTRPTDVISGLLSSSYHRRKNSRRILHGMLFIFLVGISATILLLSYTHHAPHQFIARHAAIQSAVQGSSTIDDVALPLHPIAPAVMTGITLQAQSDMTYLRFLLNQNVLYRIAENTAKHQLIITIEHALLTTSLPKINYSNSAISNIAMKNQRDGDLNIVVTLRPDVYLQHLELVRVGQFPEFQLDFFNKKIPLADDQLFDTRNSDSDNQTKVDQNKSAFTKEVVVDINAEQIYQKAVALSSEGNRREAMSVLSGLIQKYPNMNKARQLWVTLLIQSGNNTRAQEVLQNGLLLQPENITFLLFSAKLLVEESKVKEALGLLEKVSPSLKQYPDYYAFVAALYQRTGQPSLAAKWYEQLLAYKSDNAVWWAGLGIAFDSMGKGSEAREAFRRADNSASLNPDLKAYIETRMLDA